MRKFLILLVVVGITGLMTIIPAAAQHFSFSTTATPYAITVQNAVVDGGPIAVGDEIGAFALADDGMTYFCIGAAAYSGVTPIPLQAWLDDPLTPFKDGYTVNEPIVLRIWDADAGLVYETTPVFTYAGQYGAAGPPPFEIVTMLTTTTIVQTIPTVGEWALIVLILLMMISATVLIRERVICRES